MKNWTPKAIWKNQPCYILGGGSSLSSFDMGILRGKKVIGCNAACYLGADLIGIIVFGDAKFFPQHEPAVKKFVEEGGWAISSSSSFHSKRPTWLKWMPKKLDGLGVSELGWNGNTGSSAINVALLLGADPIYLLGFDMQPFNGRANYHDHYGRGNLVLDAYKRFGKGMQRVARDLPVMFPGQHVINLEDGTSLLDVFPKESLKAHFNL